jgi:uncharacterized membrane protein HdeD (DUF308 family)
MNDDKEINRKAGWSIALSVLMIVAGVLAIIVTPISGLAVTILVGWLLIFCGAMHLAFAWHRRYSGGLWWGIILGIIYIAAGGYILWRPLLGLESLTMLLGAYLVLEAVLEVVLSFELRRASGSGWLLFDGIVTLILAGMIWWTWPSSSLWVIGTLVGISMIFSGVSRLVISVAARRVTKNFEGELHGAKPAH